ncbi:MAG: ribonuclease H-like domain-containing protein [Armatimonadota bacterium]
MKWSKALRKKLNSMFPQKASGASSDASSSASEGAKDHGCDGEQPPRIITPDTTPAPKPFALAGDLNEATGGRELQAPVGAAYLIEHPAAEMHETWVSLDEQFAREFDRIDSALRRLVAEEGDDGLSPEDLAFFDLETTGLSNTPLFLIGAMSFEDGGFVIRQYFARHYGEEPAVISAFADDLAARGMLVSFNGKSFDWPYTQTRAVATRTDFNIDLPHLDLLHVSRRTWKDRLPNCQLQTLESHICGRSRTDDIPGAQIPEAYHEYVRSGRIDDIIEILNHNVLDLLTMADLMVRMPD